MCDDANDQNETETMMLCDSVCRMHETEIIRITLGFLIIFVQNVSESILLVALSVGLCCIDVVPARPFAWASVFLYVWNSLSSRTLQVNKSGHGSLLLGALLARSAVYFLSFVQDEDHAPDGPGEPIECHCDAMDETSEVVSEVLRWFYSKWCDSLECRKIICSEIRADLSKQAFKLRLHDLKLGELRLFSVSAVQVRSVEFDAVTKRLKNLLMDFKVEYEGSISITITGFWASKVELHLNRLEGCVQLHVGRNPCPHFDASFQSTPGYDLSTRSSIKGTHTLVQGAVKRLVQAALRRTAIMPKCRPIYVSPLGNMRLFPICTPLGWSKDMIHSSLEATVGRCTGVKLPPHSEVQVLLQISPAPLFKLNEAVFRPPICFHLKAHISEASPFGIVLGSSCGARCEEVEVLRIAKGSRFEDILEPGDRVLVVNGKQILGVEEAHCSLRAAIGSVEMEVLRHPAFSWSHKRKKMLPRDSKLKLRKDLYYTEDFNPWKECNSEGCKRISLEWAENTLSDGGEPSHKTGASPTMSFFESFELRLSNTKYSVVNVAVFSISQESESELLSFAAIPLSLILTNCCKMLSGRTEQIVPLLNPHVACWSFKPEAEVDKMFGNSDFDPRCCYGEIEMYFKWKAIAE